MKKELVRDRAGTVCRLLAVLVVTVAGVGWRAARMPVVTAYEINGAVHQFTVLELRLATSSYVLTDGLPHGLFKNPLLTTMWYNDGCPTL